MLFGSESWLTAAREMFKGLICWIPGLLTHYEFYASVQHAKHPALKQVCNLNYVGRPCLLAPQ